MIHHAAADAIGEIFGDHHAGHHDAGLRPPRRHPLRQPLGRVTAEPRHECAANVSSLSRPGRRGHLEPAAAQLRLARRIRMDLQAIVPPEIEDALAADELARRARRIVRLHVPPPLHDPGCLPAHDRVEARVAPGDRGGLQVAGHRSVRTLARSTMSVARASTFSSNSCEKSCPVSCPASGGRRCTSARAGPAAACPSTG